MKTSTLCKIVFAALCCLVLPQQVRAFCNAGTAYGYSYLSYDSAGNIVDGYSATELDYCAGLNYDPYVEGYLYDQYNSFPKDYGYSLGYADWWPAEVFTSTSGIPGTQYTLLSDHYVVAYFYYTECRYYDYYGNGCGYYDYYWYDPWGYDFLPGGTYGSWYNFFSNYASYYYTYQYYYIGTTGYSIITPSECTIQRANQGEAYTSASTPCQEQPTVKIAFTESGVPLAGTPPSGSAAVVDSVTMKAEGNFFSGTFSWSVINGKDKVSLTNTTSEYVTVTGLKESGAREDVTIQVTYTVNGQTARDQKAVTVQKPTAMKFVTVTLADRANPECAVIKDEFGGPTAGREKKILWRVVDKFGDPMKFRMPLSSTTNPSARQNGCRLDLSGVNAARGARTDSDGSWEHHYHFCTGQCVAGRTCQTMGNQRYNVNGFPLTPIPFTFACGGISVSGDGSATTRPRNATAFVSQSVPETMEAGQSYYVSVTMMNTGDATWTASDLYRLGSQNYQDNYTWGIARVDLPASVPPDSEVTFNYIVTAPSMPGTYNFQWAMVQDGVEWFGDDSDNTYVNVTSPVSYCDWWMQQDCWERGGSWDERSCTCYGGWYNY